MRGSYAELWHQIASSFPERTALVSGEQRLSYAKFEEDSSRLGALLQDGGLQPGDRIAFFLFNCAEYLIAMNAALKVGAVPVAINFRYRERELSELLEDCEAAALVYPSSLSPVVNQVEERIQPGLLLEIDDGAPGIPGATAFEAYHEHRTLPADQPRTEGTLLVYTGGTTGRPKAVVWDEADLLEIQMYSTYGALGITEPEDADGVIRIAGEQASSPTVTLPLAPFIHATALFNAMNTFLLGGTVVVSPGPSMDPRKAAELIRAEQVTRLIVAGDAVALPLLEALETADASRLERLDTVISSGMRFSDETKARVHALGDVSVVDVLASTEGGPYATAVTTSAADLPARFRLMPNAVVFDPDLKEVQDQPGATGILGYRGALPRGYYRDEKKTRETYPVIDGRRYVIPGDHVRVQEDGYLELLGRGSSVVNTGGEKVFPGEVEEALMAHPDVTDAVVFGIPDPRWGERVTAAVAIRASSAVDPDELIRFVKQRLAGYKVPRQIIIRDGLDRSPAGKINMRALKKDALETA